MRKIILMLSLMTTALFLQGQQDAQYTQFMFNKLSLNPAYAVSEDYMCISCLHRSQWMGLEGAPVSQSLNARFPMMKKNAGFGLSVNHDVIGPTNSWSFSGIYAYRLKLSERGNLGIGLQGTLRRYQVKWNETTTIHSGDGIVPTNEESKMVPNIGLGVYYYTPSYFIGLSMPHILEGDLTMFDGSGGNTDYSREEMHAYLMAGFVVKLTDAIKFKPSVLMKYVKDTPFDVDINGSFIFFDTFWAGLSYRMGGSHDSIGESISGILQLQASRAIRVGLSYDFTMSKLKDYNDGSWEVTLEYCLNPGNERLTNPRFF